MSLSQWGSSLFSQCFRIPIVTLSDFVCVCCSPRGYSPEAVSLVEFNANENHTVGKLKTLGAKNNLFLFLVT